MKKIVYVTGCLGFMGSHVTEACLKKGWYVMGVDKCTYAADISLIDNWAVQYTNQFKFIQSDINDLERLYDCDYIINMAAETHVDNSIEDSDRFVHSNINDQILAIFLAKICSNGVVFWFWASFDIVVVIRQESDKKREK